MHSHRLRQHLLPRHAGLIQIPKVPRLFRVDARIDVGFVDDTRPVVEPRLEVIEDT